MRNPRVWSVSLGRWWSVDVRLHMMFFIVAAFVLLLTSQFSGASPWLAPTILLTLFVSVLLHEVAHVVVARRLGGYAEDIVLTPFGGHNSVRVPYEPHSELVALMAGILANATICFICGIMLGLNGVKIWGLLQPTVSFLRPDDPGVMEITRVSLLQTIFWVNWSLILVNLLPAYPFDAGQAMQSLMTFFWPELEPKHTHGLICRLGKVLAAVALIAAWFSQQHEQYELGPQPPLWFALVMLSIYMYFSSRSEEVQQKEVEQQEDTVFGYDFSQGYTSLERSAQKEEAKQFQAEPSLLGKWLERRREVQREREQEQEAEDERRIDEVLQRLHEHGMPNLSKDDRALLNRVSERYRSREST